MSGRIWHLSYVALSYVGRSSGLFPLLGSWQHRSQYFHYFCRVLTADGDGCGLDGACRVERDQVVSAECRPQLLVGHPPGGGRRGGADRAGDLQAVVADGLLVDGHYGGVVAAADAALKKREI